MNLTRRDALKLSASAIAAGTLGLSATNALADKKKKIPIGLQLYSVRAEMAKDVPGTIAAVAKMGYQGVEFAGYYDWKAADLRKLLDDNGVVCCGTHTGLDTLLGDQLEKTIEYNKTLGNAFLIVPGLPDNLRNTPQACKKTGELLTELAEKVKPQGMFVGYHAHGPDFAVVDGKTTWTWIFENTSKDVIAQMDTGNCLGGGGDPVEEIKRFPGQGKSVHLKPFGNGGQPIGVGEGNKVPWETVFELCRTIAGTEWYVVEYEDNAAPPIEGVDVCLKNLKKMGIN